MFAWHKRSEEGSSPTKVTIPGRGVVGGIVLIKERHKRAVRFVSLVLSFLFLYQEIAFPQSGGQNLWNAVLESVPRSVSSEYPEIPYDLAQTQEAHIKAGEGLIIQIQDAHASLSAQNSIVKLLDSLVSSYDLKIIALEGAKGYIDTSVLATFPEQDIRDDTADFLMREGRMSAGEFYAITRSERDIILYGVEDDELYRKNVESFRAVTEERALLIEKVDLLLDQFGKIGLKAMSPELLKFEELSTGHREGRTSFVDYWKKVGVLAERFGMSLDGYDELGRLFQAVSLEGKIDFLKANTERRSLMDDLSTRLNKMELEGLVMRSIDFKEDRVSQSSFHVYLISLADRYGISPEGYNNLIQFSSYVTIYESIDLLKLYKEIDIFEKDLREKMYSGKDEKDLYEACEMLRAIKRLYSMELTNSDHAFIRENMDRYDLARYSSMVREGCKKYSVKPENCDIEGMLAGLDEALEFYRIAEERDSAMLSNTVKRMSQENASVAALITGGYHTKGISGLLRSKGLSYLVIAPKFEKGMERPYVAILTNKKKSYEKLLDSGKYQLAVEAYFYSARGDIDGMKQAIFHALCEAAILGKDIRSVKSRWIDAYSRKYAEIYPARIKDVEFDPVDPEVFSKMLLEDLDVRRIGGDSVVIRDGSGRSPVFLAFNKGAEGYEFSEATESQKMVFTQAERPDRDKRTLTGVTEGDIEELKAWLSTEGLVSEISSRLGDKDGSGKVIDLLKAKGVKIPREWKSIPQVRDVIQPFVSVTLAVKASSMPEEPAMERVVTHREVNAYIAANLPEGLRADTLAERKALLAKMVPEKVNSEDYGVDYGVSARVISIQGLYDATGLKAQIGLGSVYGEPVIYADADYADARVYLHEFYDMKHWEEERRKLLKDPEEMRAWILANMDEARAIHSRIEGSNPHIMVRTLSKDPALIYSNEEDIIIASLPRETMPRGIEMSLERELAETRKKIEEYEAKAYSIMSQIRAPEEVFSGRSLEVIKNAGELTVVGDCHGDYDAVTAHLEAAGKISPDGPGKYAFRLNRGDVIVFTGDYIDRGNKNVDMVEFVIAMKEAAGKAGARVITIEGNHDYMMREFLERLSYMVEKGTKPGMEDLFELSMFVALELTGNPRVADDLWNTLTEFMDRYLPPKGSLKRKAYLSWYGSEGAMLNGALARAGITEFFGGLKRLAVVDNNVFAHANVPPMDGPTKITRRMGRIMNSPGAPLREVDTVISDIYENLIEDADIYAEANGKTEEEKYGMKIKYYSLAWPYMARNRLYLDLMASIERDEIYSFFRGHLGLPSNMPFRLWVGHDPEKGRVFRGDKDTPGEDVIIADSGITRRYRTGAGLGGGIMARGGISVLKADGTMLVHRLQRDENDLIQGSVVDGRYIYRGESPREVLPGQNADIIRSAENVRDLIRGEKDRILQAQLNLNRIRSGLEAEVTPARRKLYDELNGLEDVTKKFLLAETSFVPGDVVVNEIELDSFNPENIRVIEGLKGDSADIKIIGLRDGSVGRGTINVKSMAGAISLGEYKVFRSPAAPAWRPDAAGIHDMGRSAGDMPREGDIVIPAAEIPQGTQFMGEALTPGEVSRILANTSVHGDPFNGRRLTVKMLEEKGLSPAIRIVVQGVNVLFSSKAYVLEGGRIAVVAYVEESPGQYVARSYYLSNSQSMWRYLPSYTAETDPAIGRDRLSWYHKGYSEHSLTLPSEIQEALGAMTRVPSNTVMIEKDEAMLVFAGTSRRAAHEYELPEDATYVHSVDRTPEKLSDGFFADWQRSKRLVDPEKLDFSGSPQRPDYENGFLASFKMATDFYGEVTVEVYRSVDGKYKYMLCSIGEGDSRRAWFGGVELSGEISGLGLHGKWVNTGNLTTPLYEYYAVSEGYGTERHSSDRHYVSMWEKYLSRAPAIQEYLAHLAALEPDDFPTPPTEIPASEEKMSYQRMRLFEEIDGFEDVTDSIVARKKTLSHGDIIVKSEELSSPDPVKIRTIERKMGTKLWDIVLYLESGQKVPEELDEYQVLAAVRAGLYKVFRDTNAPVTLVAIAVSPEEADSGPESKARIEKLFSPGEKKEKGAEVSRQEIAQRDLNELESIVANWAMADMSSSEIEERLAEFTGKKIRLMLQYGDVLEEGMFKTLEASILWALTAAKAREEADESEKIKEAARSSGAKEYLCVLGMPSGVYDKIVALNADISELCKKTGVDQVVRLESYPRDEESALEQKIGEAEAGKIVAEARIKELSQKTRGARAVMALLDADIFSDIPGQDISLSELEKVMDSLARKAEKDITELSHPEITSMDKKTLQRIDSAGELRHILKIIARVLPEGASYDIKDKGLFNMRIDNMRLAHKGEYSEEALSYLASYSGEDKGLNKRRYLVSAVDNKMDLRLVAGAILERRTAMGVKGPEDDPITDIVVIKDNDVFSLDLSVMRRNAEVVLKATGLDKAIDSNNLVVMPEEVSLTPKGIIELVHDRKLDGDQALSLNIAIGAKEGVVRYNQRSPGELFSSSQKDSLVMVEMKGGLTSQMYRMLVEISAGGERVQDLSGGQVLRLQGKDKKYYNVYIYLPKMEKIDLKAEAKNYEIYIRDLLTKA